MSGNEAEAKRDVAPEPSVGDASATAPRRPYRAPQLRRLGSVRELTFGSSGVNADGGGTLMMNA